MTIKEAEKQTGLVRSNIRFYEKEKLVVPARDDKNGYRDYSKKDIDEIKKIAYLRTLDISIEDIRAVMSGKEALTDVIKKQAALIQTKMEGLDRAKMMCEKMLKDGEVSFEELDAEKYVINLQSYWKENKAVFRLDAVRFLYIWGSLMTWGIITLLCALAALAAYTRLPAEIPVQWSHGAAVSFADKRFIFMCPAVCILIRVWLRPAIYCRLLRGRVYGEPAAEYLSNYVCFLVLSAEMCSILYAFGLLTNVVYVLLADTGVLIGILAVAGIKRGMILQDLQSNFHIKRRKL